MYILSTILSFLLWPTIIIGLIIFFVRRKKRGLHPANDKNWYLQIALSKEDGVSQLFLLLSIFFLGVTLFAFNRDLGDPFSWHSIVFLTSALALASAYYLKTLYSLAFGLVGMTVWWGAQAIVWIQEKTIASIAIFSGMAWIGLLFYSLGRFHERETKWKRFALVYFILGAIPITATLFALSSKYGLSSLTGMMKGASFFGSWQITVSLLLLLVALVGVIGYTLTHTLMSRFEALAVSGLALLFGMIALLPQQDMFMQSSNLYSLGRELSAAGVLWAIFFNAVAFFELLGLILLGYVRRETWLINLGAILLFLFVVVKYFDWFFTFLDKSIFFIIAGILLFAVGWFMERGRRYMISNIKAQSPQIQ